MNDEFPQKELTILMPVFNDWSSLKKLIGRIDSLALPELLRVSILVINDGSNSRFDPEDSFKRLMRIEKVEILHLSRNLGHQRAIAVALAYAEQNLQPDLVLVMDADGEDRPEDIARLLEKGGEGESRIIFAQRSKRSEGLGFRCFYRLYQMVYRLSTGSSISFGNFCLIPFPLLRKLVCVSEIWNHFSAGVIRSRLPFTTIPTFRGKRIGGKSTMKWNGLVIHGLSALAVHMDVVAVRLLLTVLGLIACSVAALGIVFGIRIWTDRAIPGWATNISIGLAIIIMQSFLISLFLAFLILNSRTQRLFLPRLDYVHFILTKEQVYPPLCLKEIIPGPNWSYSARPKIGRTISAQS